MNENSTIVAADIASPANRKPPVLDIIEQARFLDYRGFKEQIRFIVSAVIHRQTYLKLTHPDACEPFERLILERPQYLWLLTAPYIDARWSRSKRVDRLIENASVLRGQLSKYDFSVFQSLHLLDLAEISIENYNIVIDKPLWFCHEGLITLNLFRDNFRFFSITFSFYPADSGIGIIIGGIQGRRIDGILAQYRDFTRMTYGLRPRDFLFEVLRIIARAENVKHILGIPDQFRYHRHGYFRRYDDRHGLYLNYDEIWKDRGGVLTDDGMYQIPLMSERRLSRIAARKRSMYRRRYALLDKLAARIGAELQTAVPITYGPVE